MNDIKLPVVLHKNQLPIHTCQARNIVIKAGKQFGKSKWAVFELVQRAGKTPNGMFWYVAPSYRMAKGIAWIELLNILPEQLIERKIETELIVVLKGSKARIELKGSDNEDSLRGVALDGVIYDEAAYIKDYVHTGIIASQLLAKKGFAYWISTPHKDGKNWFSNLYDEAKRRQGMGDKDWAAFYYTTYDNPYLDPKEIDKQKERTTESTFNLEYLALEPEHSGVKFQEFDEIRNIEEVNERAAMQIYRGLDYGIAHPTVCLWAKLDPSTMTVYVYDEYVKRGSTITEICSVIKEKTADKPVEFTVIDPSSAKRDFSTGRSISSEYGRYGIPCISGDNRDRGYDIVKMFLKTGKLKISPKCRNLIVELRTLMWGDKENDDCTDALRYLLVKLHDTIYGMNFFDKTDVKVNKLPAGTYSFYDKRLFPDKQQNKNWLMDEIKYLNAV